MIENCIRQLATIQQKRMVMPSSGVQSFKINNIQGKE